MSDNTIASFLVNLGWKNDDVAMRKTLENVEAFGKKLTAFAVAAEAASLGVVAALGKMSQAFEDAYYQSSRTGATIKELKSFEYAASQMGSTAEEAASAVEGLARKMRENPQGYQNFLKSIGVTATGDNVKDTVAVLKSLAAMPQVKATAYAGDLGIPEHLLIAARRDYPALLALQEEYNAKARAMGVDLEKAGKDGKDLSSAFRSLGATFDLLKDQIGSDLFKELTPGIKRLNDYLMAHGKDISQIVTKIAGALLKLFTYLVEHLPELDAFVTSMGGWETALTALAAIVSVAFIGRVAALLSSMLGLSRLVMPSWLMGFLVANPYVAGAAAAAAVMNPGDLNAGESERDRQMKHGQGDEGRALGGIFGAAKSYLKRKLGREVAVKGPTTSVTGGMTREEQTAYIRKAAIARGIDPNIALKVAQNEGLNVYTGDGGSSFGPYQLHYGGMNPAMPHKGLGDEFDRQHPGLSAKDPKTIRQQVDFSLDWVRSHGWGDWSGARGIMQQYGRYAGVGPMPKVEPSMSPKTSEVYGEHRGAPVPVPGVPSAAIPNPFGGFDVERYKRQFNAPLGAIGPQAGNDNRVHMAPNTTINVSGVSDPDQAAGQVASNMSRQHSTLLRNLQSAVG